MLPVLLLHSFLLCSNPSYFLSGQLFNTEDNSQKTIYLHLGFILRWSRGHETRVRPGSTIWVQIWGQVLSQVLAANQYTPFCIRGIVMQACTKLFQNNWIFLISILVFKPLFILFGFFFSKESKIYCISNCLQKGRNSAKSYCLVSTENLTCFKKLEQLSRVSTKNDQHIYKEQRYHKIEAILGLSMPKNPWNNSYYCCMRDLALTSSCPPLCIVACQNWNEIRWPGREPRTSHVESKPGPSNEYIPSSV